VQACHAAIETARKFQDPLPDSDTYVVALQVANREELIEAYHRLRQTGIQCQLFYEPDESFGFSALATEPLVTKQQRKVLSRYKLWV